MTAPPRRSLVEWDLFRGCTRRIHRQRARGESLRAIADNLNRDGVPTAQGGVQWYAATVRHVLLRTS